MTDPLFLGYFIKYVGLAIAVVGCIVVAPMGHMVADIRAGVRERSGRIRALLARRFPRFRRNASVRVGAVAATATVGRATVTVTSAAWSPEDPVDERIERLRTYLLRLEKWHNDLALQFENERAKQEASLSALERKLLGETEELRKFMEEKERETVEIDGRGFWPILLGLVLTNAATELAFVPWFAWLFLLASVAVTGVVVQQSRRRRRTLAQAQ